MRVEFEQRRDAIRRYLAGECPARICRSLKRSERRGHHPGGAGKAWVGAGTCPADDRRDFAAGRPDAAVPPSRPPQSCGTIRVPQPGPRVLRGRATNFYFPVLKDVFDQAGHLGVCCNRQAQSLGDFLVEACRCWGWQDLVHPPGPALRTHHHPERAVQSRAALQG